MFFLVNNIMISVVVNVCPASCPCIIVDGNIKAGYYCKLFSQIFIYILLLDEYPSPFSFSFLAIFVLLLLILFFEQGHNISEEQNVFAKVFVDCDKISYDSKTIRFKNYFFFNRFFQRK